MEIRRNYTLEDQINDAARVFLEREDRGSELHFSDLLTPMKAYWRIKKPKPLTEREIGFFIAGRAHHEVVLSIMHRKGKIEADSDAGESKVWDGVYYTPDYNLGFLAEIKSTRKQKEPTEQWMEKEYKWYLNQLKQYMAAEDKNRAALIVFYISLRHDGKNKTTFPTIRCYQVEIADAEINQIKKDMKKTKNLILKAIDTDNPAILPLCPAWHCCSGGFRGPAIENCKWYQDCKPKGRYPEEKFKAAALAGKFDD